VFPKSKVSPSGRAAPPERYVAAKLGASGLPNGGEANSHCIAKRQGVSPGSAKTCLGWASLVF
jgi:hypothetical protein